MKSIPDLIDEEIFVDIMGYEGIYQVSNLGNVRSLDRQISRKGSSKVSKDTTKWNYEGKLLKPINCKGRFKVNLCNGGNRKSYFVDYLVVTHFILLPQSISSNLKIKITHLDGDGLNSNVSNLEVTDGSVKLRRENRIKSEIWKDIEGYSGKYQVSTKGNVRKLNKQNEYVNLNLIYHKDGYVHVNLSKHVEGKLIRKFASVHVLVAKAFIPNPDNKREVNHKDCNKHNNSVDNLEWTTRKENQRHAIANGCRSKTPVQVYCVETKTTYRSMTQCEQVLGLYKNAVIRAINSNTSVNGYHFKIVKRVKPSKVKKLIDVK